MLDILTVAANLPSALERLGAPRTHTTSRHLGVGAGMENVFFRCIDIFVYIHVIPLVLFIVA